MFIKVRVVTTLMMLKCQNPDCGYEWDYNGESKFYATCPRCKSSVSIRKQKEEGHPDENVGLPNHKVKTEALT